MKADGAKPTPNSDVATTVGAPVAALGQQSPPSTHVKKVDEQLSKPDKLEPIPDTISPKPALPQSDIK